MKIGMKFCGGCNPAYDRIAAADIVRNSLSGIAEFVSSEDKDADLVLVFMGCSSACADTSRIDEALIRQIGSLGEAEDFIKEIKRKHRM